jgi:RNA polymerase sigma factor (sigma-70 family)
MQPTDATTQNATPILGAAAIEDLIRVHGRRLRSFVRRRVGNPADVEDLVQETCLEAVRCAHKFQGQSRPETWLFGIAMNLVRNHYKTAKSHDIFDYEEAEEMPHMAVEDTLETVSRQQALARIGQMFRQLPDDTQQILELVFDDHCSYDETAAILGIPIGTVRSRISRARGTFRDSMQ